jgi:hypothetical protein
VVIIGGVIVSTFFSLLVVPCLYDLMAPASDRSRPAREELERADAELEASLDRELLGAADSEEKMAIHSR